MKLQFLVCDPAVIASLLLWKRNGTAHLKGQLLTCVPKSLKSCTAVLLVCLVIL